MENKMSTQVLENSPGILGLYARALLPKKADPKASQLPNLVKKLVGVRADDKRVTRYNNVCGFKQGDTLAPTYPHMLAFPIHMEMMLDKAFPFALMGLVHVSNQITQIRPIAVSESIDIECRFGDLRDHEKGKVIELWTTVYAAGEKVWESRSDMLARVKTEKGKAAKAKPVEAVATLTENWKLPSNLGRRYAAVSGDSNPIHITGLSAKLFGFKGHIAHGMWTKARALAAVQAELPNSFNIEVQFKLPIFLPAEVGFYREGPIANAQIEVRDQKGKKPHMRGQITAQSQQS
ncbi:MaoC domain protein dehydratase [gamma proteobacterium HTCC5015]|nr:MaoC domain protein dehydratase [gamma proteobacterium HTCC5015]